MSSPLKAPEGVWWTRKTSGQERAWVGLAVLTAVILFAWMIGWMKLGAQNPTGPTYRIDPEQFQANVQAYKEEARQADEGLVPAGRDVYIGARQWNWDGLPVVLEVGVQYRLRLSSYDVQHGFGLHRRDQMIEQFNLQVLPDYEWVVPIEFKHPGIYDVQCNEFCGVGHRIMHGQIVVKPGRAEP
jgi:cytochrome c oxidase subunit 2